VKADFLVLCDRQLFRDEGSEVEGLEIDAKPCSANLFAVYLKTLSVTYAV
jgi:hypothetical protein